jgi:hypothetical protein
MRLARSLLPVYLQRGGEADGYVVRTAARP